jgi:hypothetical protein
MRRFDPFDSIDPWLEHDFSAFEVRAGGAFFKINHYNKSMQYHSTDPTDPTSRFGF